MVRERGHRDKGSPLARGVLEVRKTIQRSIMPGL
jgi:hypothetical protein